MLERCEKGDMFHVKPFAEVAYYAQLDDVSHETSGGNRF